MPAHEIRSAEYVVAALLECRAHTMSGNLSRTVRGLPLLKLVCEPLIGSG